MKVIRENKNRLNLFIFSATMTSGDEEDYLACSYKTVIHRPAAPHFYLPSNEQSMNDQSMVLPSPPMIAAPVLVLPSPPANLPIHHRAHTDTDLVLYQQQQQYHVHPQPWYSTGPFLYPNQTIPVNHFVYAPFVLHPSMPPPAPPPLVRSSSADCRRTATQSNESRLIHPERVW